MRIKILLSLSLLICFFVCVSAYSVQEYKTNEEQAKAYNTTRVIKTVDGLNFEVQEDRPIEKVGGVYKPIDTDAYVALKFNEMQKKIDERFSQMEERITDLSKRVEELNRKLVKISKPPDAKT